MTVQAEQGRDPANTLAGQIALVTGASRGLGAAIAVELARHGAHCVLTARTQGGLEEADDRIRSAGGTATLLPLDLVREAERIDLLGPSILQRFGRLDILVHAAGALGCLTPVAHLQPRDWEQALGVNCNAAWRLIRSCDPPLRAAPAGRAVFTISSHADAPEAYWGAYGATQAALAHLVRSWTLELAQTRVRVALCNPGPMRTRLRRAAYPGEDPATLASPESAAPGIVAHCL